MATGHATLLRSPALALFVALIAPEVAAAGQAAEQGIDCNKAVSTPEVAVCASDAYDASDAKLNVAYKAAMASITKRDLPLDVQKEFRKALVRRSGSGSPTETRSARPRATAGTAAPGGRRQSSNAPGR